MKTTKTNTITTNTKAKDITYFCNILLEPAEQYLECAPKANVDEKGELAFDFTMDISDQPFAPAYPMMTFDICNINDIEDPEDLYLNVSSALAFTESDIEDYLAAFKKDLHMSDKAVTDAVDNFAEVIPQVIGEFFNAAYIYPEEENVSFAENPWYL